MTQNARVPNAVLVAGIINDSFEAERSVDRRGTLATGFKKSAIYYLTIFILSNFMKHVEHCITTV